jgi:Mce-associated membrane protein
VTADVHSNGNPKPDDSPDDGRAQNSAEALALAEEAEAEAAEAEAIAAAARARARAIRLRRQAQAAGKPAPEPEPEREPEPEAVTTSSEPVTASSDDEEAAGAPASRARWWRAHRPGRPRWPVLAASVAILAICALLGVSGYFVWHHRDAANRQHRTAEFAAAARQGVVTLMSLDFNKAKESVQRIIDDSTGQFRDDFQKTANDFVKTMQDAKVSTETTVNATAVESMTDNSAVVLVAAASKVSNSTGASHDPRSWRLSVTVARDGGQLKMSKVEFVP